jgi:hypothetical protein
MNRNEYLWYASEITTLEGILADLPESFVIERQGFESRLKEAKEAIRGVTMPASRRIRLTFQGEPVHGSYGIGSDFLGAALEKFSKAVAAVAASIIGKLSGAGPIPDKLQSQMLVVGPALGSFGVEIEIPAPPDGAIIEEPHVISESVKKVQSIFRAVAEGSDEELAELIGEVHPRASDNLYDFLSHQAEKGAWCCLDYDGQTARFKDEQQLKTSASRLARDNITVDYVTFQGTLIGGLPSGRRFELETDEGDVKKGKTTLDMEEGKRLIKDYACHKVTMKLKSVRAGKGNPRYILESLDGVWSDGDRE